MKILLLPGSRTSPSARYRVLQFVQPLRDLGHDITVRAIRPERYWQSPLRRRTPRLLHHRAATLVRLGCALTILRDVERFDVVFLNRDLIPEMRVRWLEPWMTRRNPSIIFDFDDAIFLGSRDAKLRQILPCFAAVTAGNETLAGYARQSNGRVMVLPTVVDTDYYRPTKHRRPGPLRIGWTGSAAPLRDYLPLVEPAIHSLSAHHDFEFVVICDRPPAFFRRGDRLRFIPWNPATEAEDLQQIDIGLMPLRDGPFEAAKCGAKAILYLAAGVPAVVSPVGVNKDIVVHGETGFHCRTGAEWYNTLETLLHDAALRTRMGEAGRDRAVRLYSQRRALPQLLALFEEVAARKHSLATRPAEALAPHAFS
jgi:glycosyltransferase involved in cell wall biosynthesis